MPTPTFFLSVVIATLIGTTSHLIVGGDTRRLGVLLMASWLGFAIGHIVGAAFQFDVINLGVLHLSSAFLGAAVLVTFVVFLTGGIRSRSRG